MEGILRMLSFDGRLPQAHCYNRISPTNTLLSRMSTDPSFQSTATSTAGTSSAGSARSNGTLDPNTHWDLLKQLSLLELELPQDTEVAPESSTREAHYLDSLARRGWPVVMSLADPLVSQTNARSSALITDNSPATQDNGFCFGLHYHEKRQFFWTWLCADKGEGPQEEHEERLLFKHHYPVRTVFKDQDRENLFSDFKRVFEYLRKYGRTNDKIEIIEDIDIEQENTVYFRVKK